MNKTLERALSQETPGKVFALLGAALFSLAFTFSVSYTNASFSGMEKGMPDPFAMEKVVPALDSFASAYSTMLQENFLEPLSEQYALYADNALWVFKESGLAYALGVDSFLDGQQSIGQVAGISVRSE